MHKFVYWLISSNFLFSLSYIGPKILLYTFLSKMFNSFLSLFVSVQISDAYVNVLSIIVFFSLNFSFFDKFSFKKKKIQKLENYPEESVQHSEHGESFKSRIIWSTIMESPFTVSRSNVQFKQTHDANVSKMRF